MSDVKVRQTLSQFRFCFNPDHNAYGAVVDALERLERLIAPEYADYSLIGLACSDARLALRQLRSSK